MSKKGGNFFDEHIEKIVSAVVGLVCIWILTTRVLITPNKVSYDGKKFSSREIDKHISDRAEKLQNMLSLPPESGREYEPRVDEFAALVDSAISIDAHVGPLLPPHISPDLSGNRKYNIPLIGKVNEPSAEHIRAAAYIPTMDIDEENAYEQALSEPNDIDIVTVEAKFDVASLYESFYECFAGEDLPQEWRDPCLAKPVFAAVELQRQELLADGSWGDWDTVPRTKIDAYKKVFEVIEDVEHLPPGGVRVRMFELDERWGRVDLLQPEAYKIASAEEEWFPPSIHREYVEYRRKQEAQERRDAIEAEKKEQERKREETLRERERRRFGGLEGGRYAEPEEGRYYRERMGRDRGLRPRDRRRGREYERTRLPRRGEERDERRRREERVVEGKTGRTASQQTTSVKDFYDRLEEVLLTERTDLSKMREPLVFWAHDDTVELGKSYRYQVRLGVFNPIAGTNQFSERDKSFRNRVVLWSPFSEVTETIQIPKRLYFFPVREVGKVVTVKVAKYVLGYWYGRQFPVLQGEIIGRTVDYETVVGETEEAEVGITVPEKIDFGTGAVLVDITTVNDWSGGKNLQGRYYPDMLYSFGGTSIEHMPIKLTYWPQELQNKFHEVERSEKEPRKPLRPWGSRREERRPRGVESRREGTTREDMEREAREEMME
jgi:hypothetical protein